MKKFVSMLVILAMFATLLPLSAFSAFAENETVGTPISTWDELKAVANTDGRYVLSNDLDLGGATVIESISLIGELDGAGHSIKNFTLSNAPLFTQGGNLTVKNLNVGTAEAPVLATYSNTELAPAGVLFAKNNADNTLALESINIYAKPEVTNAHFGLFMGQISGGTVTFKSCLTDGRIATTVKNGLAYKGGFVGVIQDGANAQFDACVNKADLKLAAEDEMAGGLVGFINDLNDEATKVAVKNSINYGKLTTAHCGGGCVGYIYKGTLEINGFCNYGDIPGFGDSSHQAGGVVGRVEDHVTGVTIQNAVNFGDVKTSRSTLFNAGIIGRCKASSTLAVIKNCVNAGAVHMFDLAENPSKDYTVAADANCYYLATTGGTNHSGATALADMTAVLAQLNSDGYMTDFRSVWGNFEAVSDGEDDEEDDGDSAALQPNRTLAAQEPLPFEDSPFTEYVPGYVLHHMDFSKVESFDATKYFVTNDNEPFTFEIKDGELHVVAGNGKVYMTLANNGLPQNIADFTIEFEFRFVNFVQAIDSKYLVFVPSVSVDSETGKLASASTDVAIRPNLITDQEAPLFDKWAYAYSSTGDALEAEKTEVESKWKDIIGSMKEGESAKFSISIEGPTRTINKITVSQGEDSVSFSRTGDMFDFGGFITFMFRNVDVAISEITVIAGNVNTYDTLIWPGEENALVQSVSADAVVPQSGGDNTGGDNTGNPDNGNTGDPDNDNAGNTQNGNSDHNDDTTENTAPADDQTEESGCASSVFGVMTVFMMTVGAAGVICKKKKH